MLLDNKKKEIMQSCRLCKKELELTQFMKNGKTLKTCESCRAVIREAKKLKKENKNSESDNSGSDNETQVRQAEPVETTQPVVEEITEELVPETPVNSPVQDNDPMPVEPPKLKRSTRQKQEKNLPSTKRARKPRTKKE